MILGLDISTKYIGWCTLTDAGEVIRIGYLDLSKKKGLYEKLNLFNAFFAGFFLHKYKVFIEAPLPRSNNQNVVNLLQRWNGMCCASLYRYSPNEPTLIDHKDARKSLGIQVPKGVKGVEMKKYILSHVKSLNVIPEGVWENKKTGNPKDYCFDVCDSYVIAKAGYEETKN